MHATRTLMRGIVDYAGLFPPAQLQMQPTVDNFARFKTSADAWMLRRLIIPLKRLEEFETCARDLIPVSNQDLWQLGVLLSPVEDDHLEAELDVLEAFNNRYLDPEGPSVVIDSIELRAGTAMGIDHALDVVPDEILPFFELDPAVDIRGLVAAMSGCGAGAKIRTGSVDPEGYPSTDQLASFIEVTAAADICFKATAGLHLAVRHHSHSVGVMQFGFLGVFLGACMTLLERIDGVQLRELLEEEDPEAFEMTDVSASWRGHTLSIADIASARERYACSFGSCDFTEPLQDLINLRFLKTTEHEQHQ